MREQIDVLQRADVIVFSVFFKVLKFFSSSYIPVAVTGSIQYISFRFEGMTYHHCALRH